MIKLSRKILGSRFMPSFKKKAIQTEKAPRAIGPYSQAIQTGPFLFISGQLPLNPQTGKIESFEIEGQTRQVLHNLQAILEAAGLRCSDVIRSEIFLQNLDHFTTVNNLYAEVFSQRPQPARQTIQVSRLPQNSLIEISCIAWKEGLT
jgi:2-iminobutanoate/2-iminopropanoate deaminase